MRSSFLLASLLCVAAGAFSPSANAEAKSTAATVAPASTDNRSEVVRTIVQNSATAEIVRNIVRVSVTAQAYDFSRPWSKRAPSSRRALGTVLEGGRVLVTAEAVANATYIELETPDGGTKQPASVECVDYEADLALLKPDSGDFFGTSPGLKFATPEIGDSLSVLQLEANGNPLFSRGQMTTAEVVRYPIDESSFLVGRLNVPLQIRDSNQSLPVLKEGKLVGVMLRYDQQASLLDFIPAVVVEHFLKDALKTPYEGFPRMGCSFSVTRDPQLRRYLGLNGNNGGVLVTQVMKGGPADKGGLRKGDVLLEIAGQPVDSDGNYRDSTYGRISLGHLVCAKHFEGESVKVRLFRDGKVTDADVPVARRHPEQFLSEPYVIDRAPKYYVLGGLIFQELSRQYLKEFGSDWARKAPLELVNIDRTQGEIDEDGRNKIVILTRVLPSDVTVGYEDLRHVVLKSINGEIIKSLTDIPKALAKPIGGGHRLEFVGDPSLIFLDAKAVEEAGPTLQKSYGLPALSRLE